LLAAIVSSAAVFGAAVHAEAALIDVPEKQPDGGLFGSDRLVAKAVLGGSYTFDVGNGLTLLGEYHYSGFGIEDAEDAARILAADTTLQKRFLRGDTQTLGRHNLGLQASYPVNEAVTAAFLVLTSVCHFDRREKSDLPKQVILSRGKDLSMPDRSLSLLGTMLRIGFLASLEMT
jgi:hypothetical protein